MYALIDNHNQLRITLTNEDKEHSRMAQAFSMEKFWKTTIFCIVTICKKDLGLTIVKVLLCQDRY